jgi:hypothetical protein
MVQSTDIPIRRFPGNRDVSPLLPLQDNLMGTTGSWRFINGATSLYLGRQLVEEEWEEVGEVILVPVKDRVRGKIERWIIRTSILVRDYPLTCMYAAVMTTLNTVLIVWMLSRG